MASRTSAGCADAASIAAYVDGTLEPRERAALESHLAECEDCYELMAEVARTEEELGPEIALTEPGAMTPAAVPPAVAPDDPGRDAQGRPARVFPFRPRTVKIAAVVFAAAAAVVLFVNPQRSSLEPLVAAVGQDRPIAARPTGGFLYGTPRSPMRGSAGSDASDGRLRVLAEAARLRERAAGGRPRDVHAWGVAQMLIGEPAQSVRTLESLRESSPGVAAYEADLGAAQTSLFLQMGGRENAEAAIEALDRAIAIAPDLREAWFNKALVLEGLERNSEALHAWNRYLELDPQSEWAAEAREHRDRLQKIGAAQ